MVHTVCPEAHCVLHEPEEHTCPPVHLVPQAPQLLGSKLVSVQLVPHICWLDGQVAPSEADESVDASDVGVVLLLLPQPVTTTLAPRVALAIQSNAAAQGRLSPVDGPIRWLLMVARG